MPAVSAQEVGRRLEREVCRLLREPGEVDLAPARHHDRPLDAAGEVGQGERLGQERMPRLDDDRPAAAAWTASASARS